MTTSNHTPKKVKRKTVPRNTAERMYYEYHDYCSDKDIAVVGNRKATTLVLPVQFYPEEATTYRDSRGRACVDVQILLRKESKHVTICAPGAWRQGDFPGVDKQRLFQSTKSYGRLCIDRNTPGFGPAHDIPLTAPESAPDKVLHAVVKLLGVVLVFDSILKASVSGCDPHADDRCTPPTPVTAPQNDIVVARLRDEWSIRQQLVDHLAKKLRQWERDNSPLPIDYVANTARQFTHSLDKPKSTSKLMRSVNRPFVTSICVMDNMPMAAVRTLGPDVLADGVAFIDRQFAADTSANPFIPSSLGGAAQVSGRVRV